VRRSASTVYRPKKVATRAEANAELLRREGPLPPGEDPGLTTLDPVMVKSITAKVRGKSVFRVPMHPALGDPLYRHLIELSKTHGRHLVVTVRMKDGSKRRYRGNGRRLA